MSNVALASLGADVTAATSFDARHTVSAVIDGDPRTFWTTTGLFPHEFVMRLPAKASISRIKLRSANIKTIVIERCDGASPINWQPYVDQELPDIDSVQETVISTPGFPASFLKFKIMSGYVDFVTIYSVEVIVA